MRAILIDTPAKKIREIEVEDGGIAKAIGASLFDAVEISTPAWLKRFGQMETLFVDDEGLLVQNPQYFHLKLPLGQRAFAGSAIILGTTPDGESCSTKIERSVVRQIVGWGLE